MSDEIDKMDRVVLFDKYPLNKELTNKLRRASETSKTSKTINDSPSDLTYDFIVKLCKSELFAEVYYIYENYTAMSWTLEPDAMMTYKNKLTTNNIFFIFIGNCKDFFLNVKFFELLVAKKLFLVEIEYFFNENILSNLFCFLCMSDNYDFIKYIFSSNKNLSMREFVRKAEIKIIVGEKKNKKNNSNDYLENCTFDSETTNGLELLFESFNRMYDILIYTDYMMDIINLIVLRHENVEIFISTYLLKFLKIVISVGKITRENIRHILKEKTTYFYERTWYVVNS